MKVKRLLVAVALILLAVWPAHAEVWTPCGATYVAPVGGTLVIDEEYGSNNDGVGSWIANSGATITVNPNDIVIGIADGSAKIDLPFEPRAVDYVIDVGLKEWTTTGGPANWNVKWWINSHGTTSGLMHRWVAGDSDIMGQISGDAIPFAQSSGYVMRFTATAGGYAPTLITNFGDDGSCEEGFAWGGPIEDSLILYASANGNSLNNIAWVKIYTGVTTTDAPLEIEPPKWLPDGTVYVPPEGGTLVISEEYGSNSDGMGSWIANSGATITVNPNDIVIDVANGSAKMDLPFEPRAVDYVIDVGLKEWTTTGGTAAWNAKWWINSHSGMMNRWIAKYKDIVGQLSGNVIPFGQSFGYVMRFTATAWDCNSPTLVTSLGNSCQEGSAWGGDPIDSLILCAASTGNSSNNIAWIKVYTGVTTTDAPLKIEPPKWLPDDTVYVPPESGTPVIMEEYGFNNDGLGSWTAMAGEPPTIVQRADDIIIDIAGNGWQASSVKIDLPFEPIAFDYVIDVGLKEWTTTGGPTNWNVKWWINSHGSASGLMHRWVAGDSDIMGQISGDTIPFAQSSEYVMRFTATAGVYTPTLITNFGDDGSCEESFSWGGDTIDSLILYASANGNSSNRIAWVNIYAGVTTSDAPLKKFDPQVCGDPGTIYLTSDVSGPEGIPDCYVDFYDLSALIADWLKCTDMQDSNCVP